MREVEAIKFWAPWCGPCKVVSKELEGVDLLDVNIDHDEEGLALEYKIRKIPTIVFVDKEGKEVGRKSGITTKKEYQELLKSLQENTDQDDNQII